MMEDFIYKLVSSILLLMSIFWFIYTIFSNYGSLCFDIFKTYITLIVMLLNIIWNNLVKIKED